LRFKCIGKHFEAWKVETSENCLATENKLDVLKTKVDQITPLITQNFDNVQKIRAEVEEAFTALFQRLNTEKESILNTLNQIKEGR
jgi:hypothetical protein